MITIRKSSDRGHANHGWLNTFHTFSFSNYYDPKHMGFRSLRVINEDTVAPGKGFGRHPHDNMEILTYVLDGQLMHQDTVGNQQHILGRNEIQKMSAGTGILHSEFNASQSEPVHFLQIWMEPAEYNVQPSYQQFAFDESEKRGKLRLLASPKAIAAEGVAHLHQDAKLYVGTVEGSERFEHQLTPGRAAWIHVVRGNVTINGNPLVTGDAAAVEGENRIVITSNDRSSGEVLVFDLA